MQKLVIFGAGGFGKEVAWLVSNINRVQKEWDLLGFIDDTENLQGTDVNGIPVLGGIEWFKDNTIPISVVCAVAKPKFRKMLIEKMEQYQHVRFATLIEPSAIIADTCEVDEGSIICAQSVISVNTKIGRHVIVDWNCTIGHDAVLNDFCTLYPSVNISGKTCLCECVEMGVGSKLIEELIIREGTIVGAGAVVVKSLSANCTAVGVPAKPIKRLK